MQISASHSFLGQASAATKGTVVPGLLTNIVKQMRRTTRTQNRVDLAELLRQSV